MSSRAGEGLVPLDDAYELLGTLGRGASAVVLRARERATGREVALKRLELAPSDERLARFLREGEVAARLTHPGIVRVHAVGLLGGRPCLAYELIEGARELGEALAEWPLRRRVEALRQAAEALGSAHAAGLVHRDVKQENLLVDREGRVRVADFGVATGAELERLTRTHALVGTPVAMAPEQLEGRPGAVTPATDVWALGVILYEVLCERAPFAGAQTFPELVSWIEGGSFPRPRELRPDVDRALEAVCLRALDRDPRRRYPDAGAFSDALAAWLAGSGSLARRPGLLALAGLSLLLLAGAAGLAARGTTTSPRPRAAASATPAAVPSEAPVQASPAVAVAEPPGVAWAQRELAWTPRRAPPPPELLQEGRYPGATQAFLFLLDSARDGWKTDAGAGQQLGHLLLAGTQVRAHREAALAWLRWSAQSGMRDAMVEVALALGTSSTGEAARERLSWLARASSQGGHRRAMLDLARSCLSGDPGRAEERGFALHVLAHLSGAHDGWERLSDTLEGKRLIEHPAPGLDDPAALELARRLLDAGAPWRVVLRGLRGRFAGRGAQSVREASQVLLAGGEPGAASAIVAARILPRGARESLPLLRRAASLTPAGVELGAEARLELVLRLEEEEDREARREARALAAELDAAGNPGGKLLLGRQLLEGNGGPRDLARAERCVEEALRDGGVSRDLRPDAFELLARVRAARRDLPGARRAYERAAELKGRSGRVTLAEFLLDHPETRAEGEALLRELARGGWVPALSELGSRLLRGPVAGVTQDLAEARRVLAQAVEGGDRRANLLLAEMLREGQGGPVDLERALVLYRRATQGWDPRALTGLGLTLLELGRRGGGLEPLRQAAAGGYLEAMRALWRELEAEDPGEAERWLREAVWGSADPEACVALARAWRDVQPHAALGLLLGVRGRPEAQVLMGDFCRDGVGCPADLEQARRAYTQAIAAGQDEHALRRVRRARD
ncbi:MAG: protein kinase [Planctomycetota bacterium]